jgi:hypothetical protein
MTTTSSITPDAHTFNPGQWLVAFKNRGGGWTATPDGETTLGILVCGNDYEREARAMLTGLDAAQSSQIRTYIREMGLVAGQDCHPDAAILRAWERRRAALERHNAVPMDNDTDPTFDRKDHMTDAERAEWAIIDAASGLCAPLDRPVSQRHRQDAGRGRPAGRSRCDDGF